MRTHLLTGPGGAGTSSVAAALATALAHGARPLGGRPDGETAVTLAYVGEDGSAARLLGPHPAPAVLDLARAQPWGELDEILASTVERFGGNGDIAEEWRRLPGADVLAALVTLGEAVAATDVLVVDLGDLRRAGQLLGAATRMPWVLRGLLGLQAVGARLIGGAAAHAVPRWLDAVEAAAEVLRDPDTLLHLVVGQAPTAAAKIRRGAPALLLCGASPGLLIGTPGDAPGPDRAPATGGLDGGGDPDRPGRAAGTAYAWAPFTPAAPLAWPADAQGRLRPEADELVAPLLAALDGVVPTPSEISRAADHLTWRVPLPWVTADDIVVEHRGEDLVVTVHGVPHLLLPPAVVRRCTPVRARLTGTYVEVESVLREGAWRRREP